MRKEEFPGHWRGIEPGQDIAIEAVPYKHKGSTCDQDGIRLTGSRDFIDSILSRLKDLLDHENGDTRLQVVYKQSQDRETGAMLAGYNCYIQVHERGHEAKIMNAIVSGAQERLAAKGRA